MPDLERIQQNTPGSLSQQWYEDGAAVDPGTVTIGITRADGTVLVAAGTATTGTGTAARTFNLTTAHTALLDRLTVTWSSTGKGVLMSVVEIVGGFLFTIAQFRALGPAYANVTNYPTATVTDMRITVEQALEDACDVAFVPRYYRETFNGTGTTTVLLRWPKIRTVRSASLDDTDITPLSSVVAVRDGIGYLSTGWTGGYGNVTVAYEHGWDTPPARIKRAALLLAKRWITPSAVDDRAINMTNETGTYAIMQAGVRGHLFDLPEVVAAVDQYSLRVGVA
jgi:hypothetical protein